jgi:putative flippase GtrA
VAGTAVAKRRKANYGAAVARYSAPSAVALGKRFGVSRNLVLYAVFGIAGVAVDLGVFAVAYRGLHLDKNLAAAASSFCATTLTFLLNARLNFRQWNRLLLRYALYLAVAVAGLGVTLLTFYVFVDLLHYPVMLVKVGSLGLVFIVQFTLNRLITFRSVPLIAGRAELPATAAAAATASS